MGGPAFSISKQQKWEHCYIRYPGQQQCQLLAPEPFIRQMLWAAILCFLLVSARGVLAGLWLGGTSPYIEGG